MQRTRIALAIAMCWASMLYGGDPPTNARPRGDAKTRIDTPLAYKDAGTGILIYVESDRRHVAAIDSTGKILWHRDIVTEEAEKTKNPRVVKTEPLISGLYVPLAWHSRAMAANSKLGPLVAIGFYNGSGGVIDQRTGEFADMGHD
jgi:hypothetical protein